MTKADYLSMAEQARAYAKAQFGSGTMTALALYAFATHLERLAHECPDTRTAA